MEADVWSGSKQEIIEIIETVIIYESRFLVNSMVKTSIVDWYYILGFKNIGGS